MFHVPSKVQLLEHIRVIVDYNLIILSFANGTKRFGYLFTDFPLFVLRLEKYLLPHLLLNLYLTQGDGSLGHTLGQIPENGFDQIGLEQLLESISLAKSAECGAMRGTG